jgi:hypothetical protein
VNQDCGRHCCILPFLVLSSSVRTESSRHDGGQSSRLRFDHSLLTPRQSQRKSREVRVARICSLIIFDQHAGNR